MTDREAYTEVVEAVALFTNRVSEVLPLLPDKPENKDFAESFIMSLGLLKVRLMAITMAVLSSRGVDHEAPA